MHKLARILQDTLQDCCEVHCTWKIMQESYEVHGKCPFSCMILQDLALYKNLARCLARFLQVCARRFYLGTTSYTMFQVWFHPPPFTLASYPVSFSPTKVIKRAWVRGYPSSPSRMFSSDCPFLANSTKLSAMHNA